jgi:hypothetical protein
MPILLMVVLMVFFLFGGRCHHGRGAGSRGPHYGAEVLGRVLSPSDGLLAARWDRRPGVLC